MKDTKKYNVWDVYMAMSLLMGMFCFPILMFSLFFDNIGTKALVILLIVIPYYCGLYKFRKGIFGATSN